MENSVLLHEYKIPAKGIKKKTIYHFSDVHLTEYDALSSENEKAKAKGETLYWENMRCEFAEKYNEPYIKENETSTHTHLENILSAAEDGDALIITGDLCDYINGANLRTVQHKLSNFKKPFMYVLGNHENKDEIPDNLCYSKIKNPVEMLDLGDLLIIGFDNSARRITPQQNAELKKALNTGKPLLIAMHVPIMTEDNRELLLECGEYFRLNHKDATPEVFEFIDIIKQNKEQIVAVLAGHLHFRNNTEIAKGVTQYVSSQGALGNINRYEIGV